MRRGGQFAAAATMLMSLRHRAIDSPAKAPAVATRVEAGKLCREREVAILAFAISKVAIAPLSRGANPSPRQEIDLIPLFVDYDQ